MRSDGFDSSRSWMIAASSIVINFLILAPARLSGQLFVFFMDRYQVDRETASFPFTICFICRTLTGPLAGYLAQEFGLQKMTIIGCALSAIGVGLCFFSEEILSVTLLLGTVYGLGYGFVCSLAPEFLNLYFEKHLSKANGIAMGGACLGAFLLPPLIEYLKNLYGVSGMLLIFSGLILHTIPATIILKRPHFYKLTSNLSEVAKIKNFPPTKTTVSAEMDGKVSHPKTFISSEEQNRKRTSSIIEIQPHLNIPCQLQLEENSKESGIMNPCFVDDSEKNALKKDDTEKAKQASVPLLVSIRKVSASTCLSNFSFNNKEGSDEEAHNNEKDSAIISEVQFKEKESSCHSFLVFLDPAFILISVVQSSYFYLMFLVWTVIVDFVRDKGINSSEEVYFVMCLSLSDLFGRTGLGWVTDGGYMTKMNFCAASFFGMGLTALLFPLTSGFALTLAIVFVYGFVSGGVMIIFPGMVVQFIANERRTMAMASRTVLNAPMSATISPLIGFFRETCGSYDGIFYLVAALSFICTVVSLSIPYVARFRDAKKAATD